MRKSILIAIVTTFMAFMAGTCCFADTTFITDTSKQGSLLIFPLIQTNDGNETYIFLNNTGNARDEEDNPVDVSIKCYWEVRNVEPYNEEDGVECPISDAGFTLSVNNPVLFKASDGSSLDYEWGIPGVGTGKKGILKCWVVDPGEAYQIAWNYISGYAIIVKDTDALDLDSAWKYSAWRFAANVVTDANGTQFGEGFWVGKTENSSSHNFMKLWGTSQVVTSNVACPGGTTAIKVKQTFPTSGTPTYTYYCTTQVTAGACVYPYSDAATCRKDDAVYDACPTYLIFDFLAERTPSQTDGYAINQLALAPCRQDLRSDNDEGGMGGFNFPTRLSFEIWNENESKYTGTQACVNCNGGKGKSYQVYLSELKYGSINLFSERYLHTTSGRFKVQGLAGGKCKTYDNEGNEITYLTAKRTPLVGVMGSQLLQPWSSTDLVGTGATTSGPLTPDVLANPGWIRWDPSYVDTKKRR